MKEPGNKFMHSTPCTATTIQISQSVAGIGGPWQVPEDEVEEIKRKSTISPPPP